MNRLFWTGAVFSIVLTLGSGPSSRTTGPLIGDGQEPPGCWVRGERADLELRASPKDSATVRLGGGVVKLCYSRPRVLGRPIMGRLVPFAEPWRMGADEATSIYLPFRAELAGVTLERGSYSLYAIPTEREWRIVVNQSVERWGIPIDEAVREQDLGVGVALVERTGEAPVELLTMSFQRDDVAAVDLVVLWDRTRVRIPLRLLPR